MNEERGKAIRSQRLWSRLAWVFGSLCLFSFAAAIALYIYALVAGFGQLAERGGASAEELAGDVQLGLNSLLLGLASGALFAVLWIVAWYREKFWRRALHLHG